MDPGLREYATETEARYLDALDEHGSIRKAATALKVSDGTINGALSRVRKRAASQGYSPDHGLTHGVAPGYQLAGYSHLTKTEEGEPIWLKAKASQAQAASAMQEAAKALSESIPKAKPEKPPQATESDLAACYVLTDYHMGQLSWGDETGADWDTDIAEDMLVRWFGEAVQSAPRAQTGILAQLGDFLHWDGMDAVTPTSGHLLDADTRFQRLVRVAIRSLRRVIALMLKKHQHVHVILAEGNHDIASSVWLREMFATLYADEPRVTVDTSAEPYYCFEWGATSLFFHHQHKAKMGEISRVFAGKFREVFGRTTYSYAHTGHLHHAASKEDQLMIVEQHQTLAAMDANSARGGYNSQRGASQITYHKRFGEVGRVTIRPEMVQEALAKAG